MNDTDRAQWIDNDESLYNWWRASRQSKRVFIRENRVELTECINRVLNPAPRADQYLARYHAQAGVYKRY